MNCRDMIRVERRVNVHPKGLFPLPLPENDPGYMEISEEIQRRKHVDHATALLAKYRTKLAESVGLTLEHLDEMDHEGVKNWWRTPPPH